jgi:hypothetical protein
MDTDTMHRPFRLARRTPYETTACHLEKIATKAQILAYDISQLPEYERSRLDSRIDKTIAQIELLLAAMKVHHEGSKSE